VIKVQKKQWGKLIAGLLVLLLVGGIIFYQLTWYQAVPEVDKIINSAPEDIEIIEDSYWAVLPAELKDTGFIFYPGARVEAKAYLPLALEIAKAGYPVFIPQMPLDLAVLNPEAAGEVIEKYPELNWTVGGHSLGGAMAAQFAAENSSQIEKLVLLAAYPGPEADLSDAGLSSLVITAELDGVINKGRLQERKELLPTASKWVEIQGGNHAQFGYYGFQRGDKEAKIKRETQLRIAAEEITEFIANY
jgi:hypothetical protein